MSVALAAIVASGRPILGARWGLLWLIGAWALVWVIAAKAAARLPRRTAIGLVLVAAVAVRLAALAGPPTTSDDLYRYAWDGRVQQAGVDPYRYPPAAAAEIPFREAWLWPGPAECAALHRPPGCTRINRPADRTIYPPAAEAWFAAVYRTAGIGAKHKVWQVAGLAADLITVGLLIVALRRYGRDPRLVAWYALCPAPVLEFVNNAHVDGVAVALALGAFIVLRGRQRPAVRDVLFGLLIGAAALVKVYPALLLLAVLGVRSARPWLSLCRATLAAAVLGVVAYLPHVVAVGVHVIGYLPGYLKEEHYTQGGRFLLAGLVGLSGHAAAAVSVAAVAAAIGTVAWKRPTPPLAATLLLVVLFAAATPVQPWYAVSVVPFAVLAEWPSAMAIAVAGYPYFFAVILDYHHTAALGRWAYALAAGAAAVGYADATGARSRARQQ